MLKRYWFDEENAFRLDAVDPGDTQGMTRGECEAQTKKNLARLGDLQDRLWAENKEALLIIFQAMDAAGKDSAVKHVMSGMNPQGIDVHAFKQPSREELDHDYLWRAMKDVPERGRIGIFNRSYYEDVLVGRVHELYKHQNLPERCKDDDIFEKRYCQIADYERYLWENGVRVVKFFLHVSKDEQKKRFLKRVEDPSKNWKLSPDDIRERAFWDDYQHAYETAIRKTAAKHAPWIVAPADHKWFTRLVISSAVIRVLEDIDPQYPTLGEEGQSMLRECREALAAEEIGDKKPVRARVKKASAPEQA